MRTPGTPSLIIQLRSRSVGRDTSDDRTFGDSWILTPPYATGRNLIMPGRSSMPRYRTTLMTGGGEKMSIAVDGPSSRSNRPYGAHPLSYGSTQAVPAAITQTIEVVLIIARGLYGSRIYGAAAKTNKPMERAIEDAFWSSMPAQTAFDVIVTEILRGGLEYEDGTDVERKYYVFVRELLLSLNLFGYAVYRKVSTRAAISLISRADPFPGA